jgi:hypothetical protein
LVEAALLLGLLGVVLAVFVPTFLRRVRANKILEASELLSEMSKRTSAYYGTSWGSGQHHCLPPSAGPTPPEPTVDARPVDFFSPDEAGSTTWEALGFQPRRPTRYSYRYIPTQAGCDLIGREGLGSIRFRAEGDLDGDGVRSSFELRATLAPDGLKEPQMLHVHQRIE